MTPDSPEGRCAVNVISIEYGLYCEHRCSAPLPCSIHPAEKQLPEIGAATPGAVDATQSIHEQQLNKGGDASAGRHIRSDGSCSSASVNPGAVDAGSSAVPESGVESCSICDGSGQSWAPTCGADLPRKDVCPACDGTGKSANHTPAPAQPEAAPTEGLGDEKGAASRDFLDGWLAGKEAARIAVKDSGGSSYLSMKALLAMQPPGGYEFRCSNCHGPGGCDPGNLGCVGAPMERNPSFRVPEPAAPAPTAAPAGPREGMKLRAQAADIEPHLRTKAEIEELFPRMETFADRLCQTQGMILWALKEAGLTVVPLDTSAREIAPEGEMAVTLKAVAEWLLNGARRETKTVIIEKVRAALKTAGCQ